MKLYKVVKLKGLDEKETIINSEPTPFWFYQEMLRMKSDGYFTEVVDHDQIGYQIDWSCCCSIRRNLDRIATKDRSMAFPNADIMEKYDNRYARERSDAAMSELFEEIQFLNAVSKLFGTTNGAVQNLTFFFIEADRSSEAVKKLQGSSN